MARTVPEFIDTGCKSSAEKKLFDKFKNELGDDYCVLHSLGVARHKYKPYSEADFVVVGSRGVVVFEVKGGRIERRDGRWFFRDRYGEIHSRLESPMRQASSVAVALRNSVVDHFGSSSPQARAAFGSATFFPDIEFSEPSPEYDLRKVYDLNAWKRPISEVLEQAVAYTREEVERITRKSPAILSPGQMAELLQFLRGDFELVPSLKTSLERNEEEMLRLAPQQFSILDSLSKNPRVVIEGGAGTGKTLLAMECARRHAEQGRRVLFVCFNRLLADHLDGIVARRGIGDKVSVDTLHGHSSTILKEAGVVNGGAAESDNKSPQKLLQLFEAHPSATGGFKPWDVLLVDEGQDIADEETFIPLLEKFFHGGFAQGRWAWFEDPRQSIFSQKGGKKFEPSRFNPVFFELGMNWRNTEEIAMFTSVSTSLPAPQVAGLKGPRVEKTVCDSTSALNKLENIVQKILDGGIRPCEIVLLTGGSEQEAVFTKSSRLAGHKIERLISGRPSNPEAIKSSSIYRFKGLESPVVILTDVADLSSPQGRAAAYVGMSRAKLLLHVFLSQKAHQEWEENRLNFVEIIAQQASGDHSQISNF